MEDELVNNHTTVWGSHWRDGRWGYKCCHSFVKVSHDSLLRRCGDVQSVQSDRARLLQMSYCVGEAGKAALLDAPHHNDTTDNNHKGKRHFPNRVIMN